MMTQNNCCFPEEIFDDKQIIQDLVCPIDLNIPFVENIITDQHGHSLCKICIKEWLKYKQTCPYTNQLLTKNQFYPQQLFSKNIISQLIVCCINKEQGCAWKNQFQQIQNHLNSDCEYQMIQCKNIGCRSMIKNKQQKTHHLGCPFRVLICKGCTNKYQLQQRKKHDFFCKKLKVNCHYCGKSFNQENIQIHIKQCVDSFIRCSICHLLVQRCNYQQHLLTNQKMHLQNKQNQSINPKLLTQSFHSEICCNILNSGFIKEKFRVIEINEPNQIILDSFLLAKKNQIIQSCSDRSLQKVQILDESLFTFQNLQSFDLDVHLQNIIQISNKILVGSYKTQLLIIKLEPEEHFQLKDQTFLSFEHPITSLSYERNMNQILVSHGITVSVIQIHKSNEVILFEKFNFNFFYFIKIGNNKQVYSFYQLIELKEHQEEISCVMSLQDGRQFVSGGKDGKLVIWNTEDLSFNNAFVIRVNKHVDKILCLMLLDNGNFITGTKSGVITMWNVFGPIFHIQSDASILSLAFLDTNFILSGDSNGVCKLFNLKSQKFLKCIYEMKKPIQKIVVLQEHDSILFQIADKTTVINFY